MLSCLHDCQRSIYAKSAAIPYPLSLLNYVFHIYCKWRFCNLLWRVACDKLLDQSNSDDAKMFNLVLEKFLCWFLSLFHSDLFLFLSFLKHDTLSIFKTDLECIFTNRFDAPTDSVAFIFRISHVCF